MEVEIFPPSGLSGAYVFLCSTFILVRSTPSFRRGQLLFSRDASAMFGPFVAKSGGVQNGGRTCVLKNSSWDKDPFVGARTGLVRSMKQPYNSHRESALLFEHHPPPLLETPGRAATAIAWTSRAFIRQPGWTASSQRIMFLRR